MVPDEATDVGAAEGDSAAAEAAEAGGDTADWADGGGDEALASHAHPRATRTLAPAHRAPHAHPRAPARTRVHPRARTHPSSFGELRPALCSAQSAGASAPGA